jgi:glycosyltransferase involved in cell wall biosynthesis
MNILHLANHCDEVGNGIMNVAVDLACRQANLGHRVAFASGGGSFVPLLLTHGVPHFLIEQHWRQPSKLPRSFRELRALFRSFRADIVHAHMMTGAILAYLNKRRCDFRLVTTVHNEWQRSAVLMGVGDRVIAVSQNVREQMERRGIPSRKLRVVRNGPLQSPRLRLLPPRTEWPSIDHPAIVTVAGLYERKGIGDLIEAFCILATDVPEARLYLVGDGPDREMFELKAKSVPCSERIHFVGFVQDPRMYLYQADVFVLASRSDPSPLVIPEAREAGCAIIATNCGGIPEALDGGQAGVLVPPRRPDLLANALSALLNDTEQREQWRIRARSNLESLSLTRTTAETLEVYQELQADLNVA